MTRWSKPDEAEVARALSAVGEPALRRMFFRELENPEWVGPLAKLGVFADPGVIETDQGLQAWPWPEGDYLLKVAAQRPAEVAELLSKVSDSQNPWVQRRVVEISALLPLDQAAPLVPAIVKLIQAGPDRVDETKVAELIERMIENGKTKQARKLLSALFSPVAGDEEEMVVGRRRRVSSSLDDYWYKELLGRLIPRVAELGLDGLKLVAGWLNRAADIRSEGGSRGGQGVWRTSIGAHEQNSGLYEIDDALIDAVRDVGAAVTKAAGTRDAIDFLNGQPSFLLRRIATEIAASQAEGESSPVRSASFEMLLDPSLLDLDARPEYAHLARVLVPQLSDDEVEQWTQVVLGDAWLPADDRLRRVVAYPDSEVESVTTEELEREKRRWLHRLLSAITPVLTGRLGETFRELEDTFGEVAHPEFTTYMESFTGPTSPQSADELARLPAADLVRFLRGWTPDESSHWGPSVDGLARVLEGVVAADPDRLEETHDQFFDLKPPYVRAVVAGWAQAAKTGYKLSAAVWETLAKLAAYKSDEQTPDEDVSIDDDPRWQWVHRVLADLASAVVDRDDSGLDQLEAAWQVLRPLTSHFDPTPAHEARYGGSNMDPLTLSLNTVRPAALRGAIHLLRPLSREGSEQALARRTEVLEVIAHHVGPERDPSLAVAAVLGEGYGRIANVDADWIGQHQDQLLAVVTVNDVERAWADVVVSVALRVYQAGAPFLRLMRSALDAVLSPEYAELDHTEGWRENRSAVQAAATHIIWTIAQGAIELDDPLVAKLFSDAVGVSVRAESLGHLGWQLMHLVSNKDQESPPQDFLDHVRALVEWRLDAARDGTGTYQEFAGFHWWVKSNAFGVDWWLPILDEVTAAGVTLDKTFIGEALEEAAKIDPLATIKVFDRLLPDTEYWRRYDLMQHAAGVISAAILSKIPDAVDRARSLMDVLAREGHLDVTDQVQRQIDDGGPDGESPRG